MKRTITVRTDTGPVSVLADVFGDWAVHVVPGRWSHGRGKPKPAIGLTHAPTGLRVWHYSLPHTRKDLVAVARRLAKRSIAIPVDVIAVVDGRAEMSPALSEHMRKVGEQIEATVDAWHEEKRAAFEAKYGWSP